MIITTTETIPGRKITASLGIVRGNTVRAKHIGRDIMASFRQIIGGEIKGYTDLMTEAREEATTRMLHQAKKLKADAIVNVRYSMGDIMPGAAEILAYGTAVKLEYTLPNKKNKKN